MPELPKGYTQGEQYVTQRETVLFEVDITVLLPMTWCETRIEPAPYTNLAGRAHNVLFIDDAEPLAVAANKMLEWFNDGDRFDMRTVGPDYVELRISGNHDEDVYGMRDIEDAFTNEVLKAGGVFVY